MNNKRDRSENLEHITQVLLTHTHIYKTFLQRPEKTSSINLCERSIAKCVFFQVFFNFFNFIIIINKK